MDLQNKKDSPEAIARDLEKIRRSFGLDEPELTPKPAPEPTPAAAQNPAVADAATLVTQAASPEQETPHWREFMGTTWIPWLAAQGVRLGGGLLSAEGGPTGAAFAGGAETLAQFLEDSDPADVGKIGIEAGLGVIPFGNIVKKIKPAISIPAQLLMNKLRMGSYIEGGNMLRRMYDKTTTDEEGIHIGNPLPSSSNEAAFDLITTLLGAKLANTHPRFDTFAGTEGRTVKSVTNDFGKAIEEATEQGTAAAEPRLIKSTALRQKKGASGGAEVPLSESKLNTAPDVMEPRASTTGGAYETTRTPKGLRVKAIETNEVNPALSRAGREVEHPKDPIEYADKFRARSVEEQPLPRSVQLALDAIDKRPSRLPKEWFDATGRPLTKHAAEALEHEQVAKDLAKQKILDKYYRDREISPAIKQEKAEQVADRQNINSELGGTDLKTIREKQAAAEKRAQEEADAAAEKLEKQRRQTEAETQIKDLLDSGEYEEVPILGETSEKVPTESGHQVLRKVFRKKKEEGKGGDTGGAGIPAQDADIEPTPSGPAPKSDAVVPKTEPFDVAHRHYRSQQEAKDALAGSGKPGQVVGTKRSWRVVFDETPTAPAKAAEATPAKEPIQITSETTADDLAARIKANLDNAAQGNRHPAVEALENDIAASKNRPPEEPPPAAPVPAKPKPKGPKGGAGKAVTPLGDKPELQTLKRKINKSKAAPETSSETTPETPKTPVEPKVTDADLEADVKNWTMAELRSKANDKTALGKAVRKEIGQRAVGASKEPSVKAAEKPVEPTSPAEKGEGQGVPAEAPAEAPSKPIANKGKTKPVYTPKTHYTPDELHAAKIADLENDIKAATRQAAEGPYFPERGITKEAILKNLEDMKQEVEQLRAQSKEGTSKPLEEPPAAPVPAKPKPKPKGPAPAAAATPETTVARAPKEKIAPGYKDSYEQMAAESSLPEGAVKIDAKSGSEARSKVLDALREYKQKVDAAAEARGVDEKGQYTYPIPTPKPITIHVPGGPTYQINADQVDAAIARFESKEAEAAFKGAKLPSGIPKETNWGTAEKPTIITQADAEKLGTQPDIVEHGEIVGPKAITKEFTPKNSLTIRAVDSAEKLPSEAKYAIMKKNEDGTSTIFVSDNPNKLKSIADEWRQEVRRSKGKYEAKRAVKEGTLPQEHASWSDYFKKAGFDASNAKLAVVGDEARKPIAGLRVQTKEAPKTEVPLAEGAKSENLPTTKDGRTKADILQEHGIDPKSDLNDITLHLSDAEENYGRLKDAVKAGEADEAELRAAGKKLGQLKAAAALAAKEQGTTVPTPPEAPPPAPKRPRGRPKGSFKDSSERIANLPPEEQEKAITDIVNKFKGQKGEAALQGMMTALGASAGGLAGAAAMPNDPVTGFFLGATAGVGAGLYAPSIFRALSTHVNTLPAEQKAESVQALGKWVLQQAKDVMSMLPDYYRASLLSEPGNLLINSLAGPHGAAVMGSIEAVLSGDSRGLAALKDLLSPEFFKVFFKSFPEAQARVYTAEERAFILSARGPEMLQKAIAFPAEFMTMGDITSRDILMKHGFSEAEARALTLTSEPLSVTGKGLGVMRRFEDQGRKSKVLQILFPFYRTAVNQLEQSMLRLPGFSLWLRRRWNVMPQSERAHFVQNVMSIGVGYAAYEMGKHTDPQTQGRWLKLINNYAGPYGATASLAFMAGASSQHESDYTKQFGNALMRLYNTGLPLPTMDAVTGLTKAIMDASEGKGVHPPYGVVPPVFSSRESLSAPTFVVGGIKSAITGDKDSARPTKDEYSFAAPFMDVSRKPKPKTASQLRRQRIIEKYRKFRREREERLRQNKEQ